MAVNFTSFFDALKPVTTSVQQASDFAAALPGLQQEARAQLEEIQAQVKTYLAAQMALQVISVGLLLAIFLSVRKK